MKFIYTFLFSLFIISCTNEVQDVENSNSTNTVTEDNILVEQEITEEIPDSLSLVGGVNKDESTITKPKSKTEVIKNEATEVVEGKESEIELKEITKEVSSSQVVEKKTESIETPQVKAEIHKTWDNLTKKHISSSGKVNYIGFKTDKDDIEKYIKELQSYHTNLSSWSKNKRLAYWINVYNAVTVKLIVDNYPVKSIKDLKGGKPWDTKLINLGGNSYTLNDIENKIIIPKFKEPRIHFAVNCAAKSCPKILNRAWTEDNIQRYLTKQTKAFLANSTHNTISEDKVVISKIFDWYKADFGTSNENVIKFINKYSDIEVNSNASISYNEYDWNLNN